MINRRIFYLVFLALSFVLMVMFESAYVEGVFAVAVLLPIISILIQKLTGYLLNVKWSIDSPELRVGEEIELRIDMKNKSILPIGRAVAVLQATDIAGNVQTFNIVTNINARKSRTCRLNIVPNYAGFVEIKLKKIKSNDLLGLVCLGRRVGDVKRITILPERGQTLAVTMENHENRSEEGERFSKHFSGQNRIEIFDVDKYRMGDSIRDIHWKLSSKSDELMVKRFSQPMISEANILVDLVAEEGVKPTLKGIDNYYRCIHGILSELEKSNDILRIYRYSAGKDGLEEITKEEALTHGFTDYVPLDKLCNMFTDGMNQGSNIMISSRIGKNSIEQYPGLKPFFIDWDNVNSDNNETKGEIYIQETSVIGADITVKDSDVKGLVDICGELRIDSENVKISPFSNIIKLILTYIGGFVPIASFYDTVVVDEDAKLLAIYAAVALLAVFLISFIKLRMIRTVLCLEVIAAAIFISGISDTLRGIPLLVKSMSNKISMDPLGLTNSDVDAITAVFLLLVVVYIVFTFSFIWNSPIISLNLVMAIPPMFCCMLYGAVPNELYLVLFVSYMVGLIVYGISYHYIVNTEKKVFKKSYYESTVNAGAVLSALAMIISVAIMMLDVAKGYERNENLTDMKSAVHDMFQGVKDYIQKEEVYGESVNNGMLGQVDEIKFDHIPMFTVQMEGQVRFPLYIKTYIGTDYTGNSWEIIGENESKTIKNALSTADMSIKDADALANKLLNEQLKGNISITSEEIKSSHVIIDKTNDSDTWYYNLYGSACDINYAKDGMIGRTALDHLEYDVLYIDNPQNIQSAGTNSYIQEVKQEQVYAGVVKQIYLGDGELSESEKNLKEQMIWETTKDGETVDLRQGSEQLGYTVYINAVRKYLTDNYKYTIAPGRLAEGEDFLQHFMNTKKGYCTYFATAATEMFRIYGIPARYVEGYFVSEDSEQVVEGEKTSYIVTDDSSHAWCEIYIEGYGWIPVETTPGYIGKSYSYEIQIDETNSESHTEESAATEENDETEQTSENATDEDSTYDTSEYETETIKYVDTVEKDTVLNYDKNGNSTGGLPMVEKSGGVLTKILIVLGVILLMIGLAVLRVVLINKKKEKIISGEPKEAACLIDEELARTVKTSKTDYHYDVNLAREEQAMILKQYIDSLNGSVAEEQKIYLDYEKALEMYRLIDKALYSLEGISNVEKRALLNASHNCISKIYESKGIVGKLYLRYIKCLYLK